MARFEFEAGVISTNARRLYAHFGNKFDRFTLFYSVKTNWHRLVVDEIHAEGCFFEVTSLMEWRKVAHLQPSRVVVNGPAKSLGLISEILSSGVKDLIINMDNDTDLEHARQFTSLASSVRLGLRVFLDSKDVWTRFGYDVDAVIHNIATREKVRHVQGFHFHFSTKNYLLANYRAVSERLVNVIATVGSRIDYLDIGGGLPCSEDLADSDLEALVGTLSQFFRRDIEIISEAGRFLVESAMSFVAEIISVKLLDDMRYDVAIDTNVCHLPCYWQKKYEITFLPKVTIHPAQSALLNIFGNSCMQLDCFAEAFPIRQAPRPGDRLRFSRMGAYSLSQASSFITEVPEVMCVPRHRSALPIRVEV